jgi:hypothetical protein
MRRVAWLAVVGVAFLAANGSPVCGNNQAGGTAEGKHTQEFLDPANWEGLEGYWTIKQGTIVGGKKEGIKFNTFLCSKKPYTDFELSFDILLTDGDGKDAPFTRNSGVQIRSEVFDKEKLAVKGPQCDIGESYWGSLYGEHFGGMMQAADKSVLEKALKKQGFNHYEIKCVGKHVTIKINGQATVDGDFPKMPASGIIAFQLHSGGPMFATFRNVQFTDLSKK